MSPRRSARTAGALALLGAALLSACGADPLNIVVLIARAPGDKCAFDDDTKYVSRGSLDFRPYGTGQVSNRYYQVFSWQNNLTSVPLIVNGQTVDPATGNSFIADSVTYTYQYSDPSVALGPETANMRAVIPAGGAPKDNSVPADLIQPNAAAAIAASTAIDTAAQTLVVTFQIFGKLAAGGSTKNTNKVSFPLTVYRSSTATLTCPVGEVINGGACGVPGRDAPVSCTTTTP